MVRLYDTAAIREQITTLLAQAEALNQLARDEDRDLTDEETAQFDAILEEIGEDGDEPTGLYSSLARAQRYEALVQKAAGGVAPSGQPQPSTARQPQGAERPRINLRTAPVRNFRGEVNGVSAQERAFRCGHWILATIHQQCPSFGGRFQQSYDWVRENIQGAATTTTDDGQFLVPAEFGTDLIRLVESFGVARNLLLRLTMTSDTRTDPRRTGGLTAYFRNEKVAGTVSNVNLDEVTLTARNMMVLTSMSNELSADAAIEIADLVIAEIAQAFADKEDDCAFNGDGTSTYGGIRGFRNKLGALTAGTAPGLIAGAGSTWASLTLANFESVVGALPQYADTNDAVWVCHKTFFHTVMQRVELAAGGVTAMEISTGDRRPRPIFLGYPVQFAQKMPSATGTSQVPCLLGTFPLAGRFGDRQQESIAFSDSATVGSDNLWEKNMLGIRGTLRFDINVHDIGDASTAGPVVGIETTA